MAKKDKKSKMTKGPLWNLLAIFVIGGIVLHGGSIVLYDWRNAPPIIYRYCNGTATNKRNTIGTTAYGLYQISFNDGTIFQYWNARTVQVCEEAAKAVERSVADTSAGGYARFAAACSANCRTALAARCRAYQQIKLISTGLLVTIAGACFLCLISVAWFFVMGPSPWIQMVCWGLSGAAAATMGGVWLWQTDFQWKLIIGQQIVPFPSLGICWYLSMCSAGLYIFAALGVYIAVQIQGRADARQRAFREDQKEFEAQFSGFDPLMSNMGMPPMMSGMNMGMKPGMVPNSMPGMVPNSMPGMVPNSMSGMVPTNRYSYADGPSQTNYRFGGMGSGAGMGVSNVGMGVAVSKPVDYPPTANPPWMMGHPASQQGAQKSSFMYPGTRF